MQYPCIQHPCDVVKDTGKEEYLRPFIHIGLDGLDCLFQLLHHSSETQRKPTYFQVCYF